MLNLKKSHYIWLLHDVYASLKNSFLTSIVRINKKNGIVLGINCDIIWSTIFFVENIEIFTPSSEIKYYSVKMSILYHLGAIGVGLPIF